MSELYERMMVLNQDELYRRMTMLLPQGIVLRSFHGHDYPTFEVTPRIHEQQAIMILQDILPNRCIAYVNGWQVVAP